MPRKVGILTITENQLHLVDHVCGLEQALRRLDDVLVETGVPDGPRELDFVRTGGFGETRA